MANWQWNKMVKGRQVRTLIVVGCGLFFLFAMMIVLFVVAEYKLIPFAD
ncbi:hypothetical protein [Legionella pneumophila]|nr:hypothetical protein [Legionella pneumophila]